MRSRWERSPAGKRLSKRPYRSVEDLTALAQLDPQEGGKAAPPLEPCIEIAPPPMCHRGRSTSPHSDSDRSVSSPPRGNYFPQPHVPQGVSDADREKLQWWRVERAARKIKSCDGREPEQVKDWIRAVSAAALTGKNQSALAMETSRGRLAAEIARTSAPSWEVLRQELLEKFVAHDFARLQRRALQKLRQDPKESLRAFNWRFQDVVDDGYPSTVVEAEEESVVSAYLAALYSEKIVDKILEDGIPPHSLEEAMDRAMVYEKMAEAKQVAGRDARPVHISEAREQRAATDSQVDITRLEAQVAALTTQVKKLQAAPTEERPLLPQPLNPQAAPYQPAALPHDQSSPAAISTQRPTVTCFRCGKVGHVIRQCRWQAPPRPSPNWTPDGRPVCFGCRCEGHVIKECGLVSLQVAVTASMPSQQKNKKQLGRGPRE